MMALTFATIPTIITRVRLLVAIIILVSVVVVGLVLWQSQVHDKMNDVTLNYHAATSQHISSLQNELHTIRDHLEKLSNQDSFSIRYNDLILPNTGLTPSLHIINQNMQQIISLQKNYQNPIFAILINQLRQKLLPYQSLIDSAMAQDRINYEINITRIDAALLTLKQYKRLHNIANAELIEKLGGEVKTNIKTILGILFGILLICVFITKITFNSIRAILTEQKNTENRLFLEKELIQTTLNSIGDAVITTDTSGFVTAMNPIAEKLTGWAYDEAKGLPLKEIFPIIDSSSNEPMQNPVDKVISTGEIIHLSNHTTLIAKDGKQYQISDSAAPIRDKDRILGMVLVFNDVTEQYQLREAAAKSVRNLQAIMDNSPAVFYVRDLEGRFTFINQEFGRVNHLHRQDIIGKTLHDIFPEDTANELQQNDKAALKAGHALESEEIVLRDDGLHTYFSVKFPLFNKEGNIYAISGISNDITERKKMENALQENEYNLIKAQKIAKIGNWKLDPESGQVEGSKELLDIFDLEKQHFTLDNFANVVHPEDREIDLQHINNGIKNGIPWDIEHRLLLKNGQIKWVHAIGEPILNEDGKTISIVGIVQDITERKVADETIRRSQKMDALGKLTGGIAHDYNNMLGVILGYAELLESALSGQPKLSKHAHEIFRAGKRGAKLTKKLLSFSRHKPSDAEITNINELLQYQQNMLEKTLTARIKLEFDLEDDLWMVYLDSSELEDAIVNMSINSMHAIESIGNLNIQTRNRHINNFDAHILNLSPGDYVVLSVTDTGCGMNSSTAEKIFDPFYTTKGEKGTGLGLSQVYGFVERSKGKIKVYSEPGHGTRLTLFFPCYREKKTSEILPETSLEIDLSGQETILAVDDEPALLELMSEILSQNGYKIFCASSGEEALNILEKESVDLLLSDVIMPEMDGYELATLVQKKYPAIKIQLASGFNDGRHINMGDEILYRNILNKPYVSEALLQKVRALLDENKQESNVIKQDFGKKSLN